MMVVVVSNTGEAIGRWVDDELDATAEVLEAADTAGSAVNSFPQPIKRPVHASATPPHRSTRLRASRRSALVQSALPDAGATRMPPSRSTIMLTGNSNEPKSSLPIASISGSAAHHFLAENPMFC
jgi:hypothetical protein